MKKVLNNTKRKVVLGKSMLKIVLTLLEHLGAWLKDAFIKTHMLSNIDVHNLVATENRQYIYIYIIYRENSRI